MTLFKPSWRRSCFLVAALCLWSAAQAETLYEQLQRVSAEAKTGDPAAMYELGQMYELGMGTRRDYPTAIRWYRAAAEKGNPEAAYQMGYVYYWGREVARDRAAALDWFRKAGEAGHRASMSYLSKMYALGQGVKQDRAIAARWSERAATAPISLAPPPRPRPPAPEPVPVAAPAPKPVQVAVARPAPKPAPAPKPRALSPMEKLQASHWYKRKRPSYYLPSPATRCMQDSGDLVCMSRKLEGTRQLIPYVYRITSTLSGFAKDGSFKLIYRTQVLEMDEPDISGYGNEENDGIAQAGNPDEVKAALERQTREMTCRLAEKGLACLTGRGLELDFEGREKS